MWGIQTSIFLLLGIIGNGASQQSIVSLVESDSRLTKFVQLLERVGLSASIGKTIFAPTTDAFNDWRDEDSVLWNKYAAQPEFLVHLTHLMLWHLVVEDAYTYDQIFNGNRLLLETTHSNMTIDQQFKTIDNVPVVFEEPNITASNGILHVIDSVIVPPYMAVDLIEHMLNHDITIFAFSTMANLALLVGLDDKINAAYDNGITFLVPPNRRFNRAEINVAALQTEEMLPYTKDFVLAHLVMDNYYEAGVFAFNEENDQVQFMVTSELGTSLWIATKEDRLRFQSREVILPDQPAKNGIFHVMDQPVFPPFISDFTEWTHLSTIYDTSDCYRFFVQALLTSEDISKMFNSSLTMFCPSREAFTLFNNEDFNRLLEPGWDRHSAEFLMNHITMPALTRAELVDLAPSNITMLNGKTYELRRSGERPRIKNTSVEQGRSDFGDIIALDGYLHMLDSAITPTCVSQSIYDQSRDNDDFSLLVENLDFVQLNEMVDQILPLTLLAPNNAAFRRVTFGTLSGAAILKRHIFDGLQFCDVIANETELVSVDGEIVSVELRGEPGSGLWGLEGGQNLWVGGAYVYECDLLARNGVLHHIDRVIGVDFNEDTVPPTVSPAPTITPVPTIYIEPTAAPVPLPTGFVPVVLPPVVPVVVPTVATDDSDKETPTAAASRSSSSSTAALVLLAIYILGLAL